MDLLAAVLAFAFVWAGPSALLSAWFMKKLTREDALKGFIGSLIVITGFILAVIGVIKLSSRFHKDEVVPVLLLVYFPIAGILWSGVERLKGTRLTYAQILAKIGIPPLAAAIVGIGEVLPLVSYAGLILLVVLTQVPGICWLLIRLALKKALGTSLKENLWFELLLAGIGLVSSGVLVKAIILKIYGHHLLLSEMSWIILGVAPYLVIGLLDGVFTLKMKDYIGLTYRKKLILVATSFYLSVAFVGYVLLALYFVGNSGV